MLEAETLEHGEPGRRGRSPRRANQGPRSAGRSSSSTAWARLVDTPLAGGRRAAFSHSTRLRESASFLVAILPQPVRHLRPHAVFPGLPFRQPRRPPSPVTVGLAPKSEQQDEQAAAKVVRGIRNDNSYRQGAC